LQRLEQLPQVQQAIRNKNAEDQVWQDLASFSKGLFCPTLLEPHCFSCVCVLSWVICARLQISCSWTLT